MRTAILIDGAFFLKRHKHTYGKNCNGSPTAQQLADDLVGMAAQHVKKENSSSYRIFYYDCPPLEKKVHRPVSHKPMTFGTTEEARLRHALFEALRNKRKVSLRLGYVAESNGGWIIPADKAKELVKTGRALQDDDFKYDSKQKGVDMRIGIDIATLAFKKLVEQIVLVSGDSDFVPAAKLARREGIDFIIDPMWHTIRPDLNEHVDGKMSVCPRPAGSTCLIAAANPANAYRDPRG